MVPRDHSQRTYNLSLLIPAIRTLKLGPRAAELVLVDGQTQLIPIVWLRINGMCQSARPAFQCPGCGHNRFKLFYRHGRFSGCYRCIGVPYASQQCSTKNRPRLQAARLRLFLSSLPEETQNPSKTRIDVQTTYAASLLVFIFFLLLFWPLLGLLPLHRRPLRITAMFD